jgi:hypothetical protein
MDDSGLTWRFFNRELSYIEEEYWLSILRKFRSKLRFEEPTRKLIAFGMTEFDSMWMHVYLSEGYADDGRYEGLSV